MIIKEDRTGQAAFVDQDAENPPPYSANAHDAEVHVTRLPPSPTSSPSPESTAGLNMNIRTDSQSTSASARELRVLPPSPTSASSTTLFSGRGSNIAQPGALSPSPQSLSAGADIPPTSFVHMRHSLRSITGRFALDPRIPLPPGALMSLKRARMEPLDEDLHIDEWEDGANPNMLLECKNGSIDADVWVMGAKAAEGAKARMNVLAKNGFVCVKLHTSETSSPFALRIHVKNGGVRLGLSRAFCGPVTTHTRNGWVRSTHALDQTSAVFSEVNGKRKTFVGDLYASGYGDGAWNGSSIEIRCENGRVKLFYVDELEIKEQKGSKKSWLGKFLAL